VDNERDGDGGRDNNSDLPPSGPRRRSGILGGVARQFDSVCGLIGFFRLPSFNFAHFREYFLSSSFAYFTLFPLNSMKRRSHPLGLPHIPLRL
jgi:hypothetical protein